MRAPKSDGLVYSSDPRRLVERPIDRFQKERPHLHPLWETAFDTDEIFSIVTPHARVHYDGIVVGEYFADLLVNGLVIVEIKAVRKLLTEHEAQLLNYLKATPIEVGLLLNFGPKAEYQRKVYDNSLKGPLSWTDWPTPSDSK